MDWLASTHFVARNCWHPSLQHLLNVVSVPFGFKAGFLLPSERAAGLRAIAAKAEGTRCTSETGMRALRWNFVGNANCSSARMRLIDDVDARGGAQALRGHMLLTHSFDDPFHGLVVGRYRQILASSSFTLCPEGVHVESYRLWEALEVSSIPIVTCDPYFDGLLGPSHLLPCVQDWSWTAVEAIMKQVEANAAYACAIKSWYSRHKAELASAFRRALLP